MPQIAPALPTRFGSSGRIASENARRGASRGQPRRVCHGLDGIGGACDAIDVLADPDRVRVKLSAEPAHEVGALHQPHIAGCFGVVGQDAHGLNPTVYVERHSDRDGAVKPAHLRREIVRKDDEPHLVAARLAQKMANRIRLFRERRSGGQHLLQPRLRWMDLGDSDGSRLGGDGRADGRAEEYQPDRAARDTTERSDRRHEVAERQEGHRQRNEAGRHEERHEESQPTQRAAGPERLIHCARERRAEVDSGEQPEEEGEASGVTWSEKTTRAAREGGRERGERRDGSVSFFSLPFSPFSPLSLPRLRDGVEQ